MPKLHKNIDWIRVVFLILKLGEEERTNIFELSAEFQFCVKGFTKYCVYYNFFIHNRGLLNEWLCLSYRTDKLSLLENRYWTQVCPTPKLVLANITYSCQHDLQLSLLILTYLSLKCKSEWQSSTFYKYLLIQLPSFTQVPDNSFLVK